MTKRDCVTMASACGITWLGLSVTMPGAGQGTARPGTSTFAFVNGQWFNGRTFEPRTTFSVDGLLTSTRPADIDRTIDLSGTFIVPPFADAHNHNIGTGEEARDRQAILRYLADGIFYVKIQGNLPLPANAKARLGLNTATGLDAVFAQRRAASDRLPRTGQVMPGFRFGDAATCFGNPAGDRCRSVGSLR